MLPLTKPEQLFSNQGLSFAIHRGRSGRGDAVNHLQVHGNAAEDEREQIILDLLFHLFAFDLRVCL